MEQLTNVGVDILVQKLLTGASKPEGDLQKHLLKTIIESAERMKTIQNEKTITEEKLGQLGGMWMQNAGIHDYALQELKNILTPQEDPLKAGKKKN